MENGKAIKAGMGYTIGNILIKGVTFITLPLFSRLMSTSAFGIFRTYVAYENIISVLLGLGMYASIKNANIDYKEHINDYVKTICIVSVIWFLICLIGSVVFHRLIYEVGGFVIPGMCMLLFHSLGSTMIQISNARLAIEYNYRGYLCVSGINVLGNVAISLLLICTFFSNNRGYGRIIGYAFPVVCIGIYIFIKNCIGNKAKFNYVMAKAGLAFGIPLVWHLLSQTIESQIDRIMIERYIGTAETGIYSFIYTIAIVLQVIFYSTDNVWSVWFFEQMQQNNMEKIKKVSKKYICLIGYFAFGMLMCSKEIIEVMGGEKYREGLAVFGPILVGIYLLFLYTLPVCVEYYYKKTTYIAIITVISAITNVGLNALAIPKYGYVAAAYTTFISYLLTFIGHYTIARHILKKQRVENPFNIGFFIVAIILIILTSKMAMLLKDMVILRYMLCVCATIAFAMYNRSIIKEFIRKRHIRSKNDA